MRFSAKAILSLVAPALLLLGSYVPAGAYPTGAGSCAAGPAAGGPHGSVRGSVEGAGFTVGVDGIGDFDPEGMMLMVTTGADHIVRLVGGNRTFKGFLLRMSDPAGADVSGSFVVAANNTDVQVMESTGEAPGAFPAIAKCAMDVAAVTHTPVSEEMPMATEKTEVVAGLMLAPDLLSDEMDNLTLTLEATVVVATTEWYYSSWPMMVSRPIPELYTNDTETMPPTPSPGMNETMNMTESIPTTPSPAMNETMNMTESMPTTPSPAMNETEEETDTMAPTPSPAMNETEGDTDTMAPTASPTSGGYVCTSTFSVSTLAVLGGLGWITF